jgi:hypothetical protein
MAAFPILVSCAPGPAASGAPAPFESARPVRDRKPLVVTVGQGQGDLQGRDHRVIQAAIDYVDRLGGGVVQVLPGTYVLDNALFPRPGTVLRGAGEATVLKKGPMAATTVAREADWFEYALQVADSAGFAPGCGIGLTDKEDKPPLVMFYTVTAVEGNVLHLDRRTEKNHWPLNEARVRKLHSLIYGWNASDVTVESLVLDGDRERNDNIDDNFGACVFLQSCDRWTFRNVQARNFNGDGFSFQVCNDVHFFDCQSVNNADLGFHPGSGSQRPVFRNCLSTGNREGLFFCWGACDGIAENCRLTNNAWYGVNFGHRDTDNVIRNCLIEGNGKVGVIFRKEVNEFRTGDRNVIEGCTIRNNGGKDEGVGVDVQWKTRDVTVRNCTFENTDGAKARVGMRISPEAGRVTLENNTYTGFATDVERAPTPTP